VKQVKQDEKITTQDQKIKDLVDKIENHETGNEVINQLINLIFFIINFGMRPNPESRIMEQLISFKIINDRNMNAKGKIFGDLQMKHVKAIIFGIQEKFESIFL